MGKQVSHVGLTLKRPASNLNSTLNEENLHDSTIHHAGNYSPKTKDGRNLMIRGARGGEVVEYDGTGQRTNSGTHMRDTLNEEEIRDSLAAEEEVNTVELPGVTSWEGHARKLANHQQNLPKPSLIKGHSDFNEGFALRE